MRVLLAFLGWPCSASAILHLGQVLTDIPIITEVSVLNSLEHLVALLAIAAVQDSRVVVKEGLIQSVLR